MGTAPFSLGLWFPPVVPEVLRSRTARRNRRHCLDRLTFQTDRELFLLSTSCTIFGGHRLFKSIPCLSKSQF